MSKSFLAGLISALALSCALVNAGCPSFFTMEHLEALHETLVAR